MTTPAKTPDPLAGFVAGINWRVFGVAERVFLRGMLYLAFASSLLAMGSADKTVSNYGALGVVITLAGLAASTRR